MADFFFKKKSMTIKKTSLRQLLLSAALLLFAACGKEEPIPTPEPSLSAEITSVTHYDANHMTAYNFVYPSTDPWGQPVTLSGTITIGDEVTTNDIAEGLLLYNHFTIYRADQCPSKGNLGEQTMVIGSGLITVSPDYYGFGETEDKPQAYCISAANAQAAVDALIAAKALLNEMGYHWKDNLFNAGYSQGGQTSMAVVRLVAEHYPDIHITRTFAGGGSYDLPATYRRFVAIDHSAMPSTVISVMLAYNHFMNLGIARETMFIEPLLSHIDEWILSKRYSRLEIDNLVGSNYLETFISPTMLDTNSAPSVAMMQALDSDNLCKGWTPRGDESIMLFHHSQDGAVPVENTINMAAFLQQHGVTDLEVLTDDYGSMPSMPAHETGALYFIQATKQWLSNYLGISNW